MHSYDAINDSTIYVNVGVELSLTTIFFLYSPVVDSLVCLGVLDNMSGTIYYLSLCTVPVVRYAYGVSPFMVNVL